MSTTKVTVAVPTFNRATLLRTCLDSILNQAYSDFSILVLDNASTDSTQEVVDSFADERINYVARSRNIGQLPNWNAAIELNSSPYLNIFHDDDVMFPGFIEESVDMLDANPGVACSFCLARNIDIEGNMLGIEGMENTPTGVIRGVDFLHDIASGAPNPIPPSGVMMRASALATVGLFDSPHNRYMIDRYFYYRVARYFDIAAIQKPLIGLRCHPEQEREKLLSIKEQLLIAANSDRLDAVAYLLTTDRCEDAEYRQWLQERLLFWNARNSEYFHHFVPDMYWSWEERMTMTAGELDDLIPEEEKFILVDEDQFDSGKFEHRDWFHFIEEDGYFGGLPSDDEHAIDELERLRSLGAKFMVFGWPAFWWLDYYSGLRKHLETHYALLTENTRFKAYRL